MRRHVARPTLNLVGLSWAFVYTYIPSAPSSVPLVLPRLMPRPCLAWLLSTQHHLSISVARLSTSGPYPYHLHPVAEAAPTAVHARVLVAAICPRPASCAALPHQSVPSITPCLALVRRATIMPPPCWLRASRRLRTPRSAACPAGFHGSATSRLSPYPTTTSILDLRCYLAYRVPCCIPGACPVTGALAHQCLVPSTSSAFRPSLRHTLLKAPRVPASGSRTSVPSVQAAPFQASSTSRRSNS